MQKTIFLIILVSLFASACATADSKNMMQKQMTNDKYVPFSITFTTDGKPVIIDHKRMEVTPKEVKFPVKGIKELRSMTSFTALEAIGSHYFLIQYDGKVYRIDIPH